MAGEYGSVPNRLIPGHLRCRERRPRCDSLAYLFQPAPTAYGQFIGVVGLVDLMRMQRRLVVFGRRLDGMNDCVEVLARHVVRNVD